MECSRVEQNHASRRKLQISLFEGPEVAHQPLGGKLEWRNSVASRQNGKTGISFSKPIRVVEHLGVPAVSIREVIMGTLSTLIRGRPIVPLNEPLEIPRGVIKKFSASLTVSRDLSLLTVNPHMHLLGKSFLAYAVDPAGNTLPQDLALGFQVAGFLHVQENVADSKRVHDILRGRVRQYRQ